MTELNQEALEAADKAVREIHFDSYGLTSEIAEAAIRTYLASLPPVDAEPVGVEVHWEKAEWVDQHGSPVDLTKVRESDAEPVAWMRDLDGTGSLHPASQGDPGSFPVYPAAAIIALQGEVQELNKLLSDGANGRTLAAEAEVARLKTERDELQEALDLRWKADMRAITEWREVTGRELTLPDHIDLVHFLLMGLDLQVSENQKAEAEVARLKAKISSLTAEASE